MKYASICRFPHGRLWLMMVLGMLSLGLSAQEMEFSLCPPQDQPNNIQVYLNQVAQGVSDSFLEGINSLDDWKAEKAKRCHELVEMLGMEDMPLTGKRSPLNVKKVGTIPMKGYRIDKIYYESLPNLYVPANLYIPNGIKKPVPAILYVCGHAETQKQYYQGLAHKFAQLGFVCLIIETIQWGEVRGEHWGTNTNGWFHWYSRGYNPGGVEAWNGIRGLDLLCQMPEVDPNRLGITGASGGGSQSWYLAALDDRIKAAAPAAGGEELYAEICQSTIDHQCDCMRPLNTYQRDFSDIGALVAPKPFMIAAPNRDALFAIEAVRNLYKDVKKVYDFYGKPENLSLIEANGGHGDRETLRPKIFSFFIKHLMGKDVSPEKIGDIDKSPEAQLSVEQLAVYTKGAPKDDRTKTIQETFLKWAAPPVIQSKEQLFDYKTKVVDFLQKETFGAFPKDTVPLDVKWEYRTAEEAKYGMQTFSYVPESGWRLKFTIYWNKPPEEKQSILLVLKGPDDAFMDFGKFTEGLSKDQTVVYLETRGTGETGWAPNMQWHIRRSLAWTGRTIASMRVYDVLRGIDALESIPGFNVDPKNINIAAEGEMSVVALYASLLKGDINSVVLKDAPATQNQASRPDGRGEAIEMLNCLRVTDLAQVAALNPNTKLIGLGPLPETFSWTKGVYGLFDPAHYQIIHDFSEWKP